VALAVGADDATPEIRRATSSYGYEPPFGDVPWIHFDLADGALELGKRRALAITVLHDLDLARVDKLRESMRGEIVRVVARIAQHELVELAGFEPKLVGREGMLSGFAQFDRDSIGSWRDRSPAAWTTGDTSSKAATATPRHIEEMAIMAWTLPVSSRYCN